MRRDASEEALADGEIQGRDMMILRHMVLFFHGHDNPETRISYLMS